MSDAELKYRRTKHPVLKWECYDADDNSAKGVTKEAARTQYNLLYGDSNVFSFFEPTKYNDKLGE